MNFKSIMLGTAAGLMTASVATAADLPGERMPVAVDYVRICDTFGAGFFYIPGTETCLDISGRVRFTSRYIHRDGPDSYTWTADGRVQFDARNMTEYGQLRSFFEITGGRTAVTGVFDSDGDGQADQYSDDNRFLGVGAAYIQLGYLSVGYMGSLFNDAVLYGIDDAANGMGDQVGISVVVDDLGGGFFVGAALEGKNDSLKTEFLNADQLPDLLLKVGIADQPWGGVDASFIYSDWFEGDNIWAAKLTADLIIMDGVNLRATAGYFDYGAMESIPLSIAASMALSDAATVYAGVRYDVEDGPDDIYANIGVDYAVASGLVATGELSYMEEDNVDSFSIIGRLSRTW